MHTDTELAELQAALADAENRLADAEAAVNDALYDTGDPYDGDPMDLIERADALARTVAALQADIAEHAPAPDCGA